MTETTAGVPVNLAEISYHLSLAFGNALIPDAPQGRSTAKRDVGLVDSLCPLTGPEADIAKAKERKPLHSRETTGSLAGRYSGKQMPFPKNAFKDIAPAVFETKAGTGHQVLYRV